MAAGEGLSDNQSRAPAPRTSANAANHLMAGSLLIAQDAHWESLRVWPQRRPGPSETQSRGRILGQLHF